MTDRQQLYQDLTAELRKTSLLGSCSAVLGWDEQTNLPPGGGEHRANQLSLLAGLVHERITSPRLKELFEALDAANIPAADDTPKAVNIREAYRDYDRATKLPQKLVEEISRVTTLSQQAWVSARKNDDFSAFQPWLEKVVTLKREEAQAIGYGDGIPYDALLDIYEPGATADIVTNVFTPLREELVSLVAAIRESGRQPDVDILTRSYSIDKQRTFGIDAATKIGFNFDEGRLDIAAHPFCSGFGPGDCRLTTRYDEHHFPGAFFGTLHEAGHGIYEQGLDRQHYGLPMGNSTSLGIHESQSRLWENFVGRSHEFWQHFYPAAQETFAAALSDVSLDNFHAAINDVRPSLIRVEADEVTYNLHIMLRFEIEQPLIAGDLQPGDVPAVWNEKFLQFFGITPPNDADGCMQDVHWSAGLIGYFPTYALGNMYAAQMYEVAEADLGNLPDQFARGEFSRLKEWLNVNVHRRGKQYSANRLIEVISGQPLSHEPLVKRLRQKYSALYGL